MRVGFVDEPRGSVQQADALVAELMQRLAPDISDERTSLESQWEQGADVSTEGLSGSTFKHGENGSERRNARILRPRETLNFEGEGRARRYQSVLPGLSD